MDCNLNIENVDNFGDLLQLNYGSEFGYFINILTPCQIKNFCLELNQLPWIKDNNFYITNDEASVNTNEIIIRNFHLGLTIKAVLLDHSVFLHTTETTLEKIPNKFFITLQKEWRKFLAKQIYEYRDHIENLMILSQVNSSI